MPGVWARRWVHRAQLMQPGYLVSAEMKAFLSGMAALLSEQQPGEVKAQHSIALPAGMSQWSETALGPHGPHSPDTVGVQ